MNSLMEGELRAPSPALRSSFRSETVRNMWVASESALGGFYFSAFQYGTSINNCRFLLGQTASSPL